LFISACVGGSDQDFVLSDSLENYHLALSIDSAGSISYTVYTSIGDTLIFSSLIGFELEDGMLTEGFKLKSVSKLTSGQVSYRPIFSQGKGYKDLHAERTWTFSHDSGRTIAFVGRLMGDGLAFRIGLLSTDTAIVHVRKELTHFAIDCSATAWIAPYDEVTKWTPGYELPYIESMACKDSPREEGWAFPALFKTESHFLLITESHLDGSYPGCHFEFDVDRGQYRIRFPESSEARGMWDSYPAPSAAIWTPWRVVTITEDAADLTRIKMVDALSPDPADSDWSWVVPGRSSWSWWSDHDSPQDATKLKHFIDFSAKMGWEYALIDANWNLIDSSSFLEILDYAKDRGVGLWLWYNSGGPHNEVEEAPRDRMHVSNIRRKEFSKLQEWGIKGIKIDFFQSDKIPIIQQYIEILEDAAEYKLMVNFHGCTLPRGWFKTYPHLLTMEAVRGAEAYSFNEAFPSIAPAHHCILPFTRNTVGSMDYTPVTFSNHKFLRQTTILHELALAIIFESYMLHLADSPESYLRQPRPILDFLNQIPAHWEESICVHADIGKSVVMARRQLDTWYIAGINGESKSKHLTIDVNFLKDSMNSILIFEEDMQGEWEVKEFKFGKNKELSVYLKANGGFVAQISAK